MPDNLLDQRLRSGAATSNTDKPSAARRTSQQVTQVKINVSNESQVAA